MTVSVAYEHGIAIVTIDNPPVNAASHAVRAGLIGAIAETDAANVSAVVLICAGRTFVAGADVREFGQPAKEPGLPEVVDRLEAANKLWIAAIHGTALGGGLELALACRYRIALNTAKMGLPEVHLGLIPGAGGTVRLPRLIGAEAALDMIAGGKPVGVQKAFDLGLVDRVAEGNLLQSALDFTDSLPDAGGRGALIDRPVPPIKDEMKWHAQVAGIIKKARGQNSPLAAIQAVENAVNSGAAEAMSKERDLFLKLKDDPRSLALRRIFFAERSVSKMARLKGVTPRKFANIGIVGGGTMGAGIAAACLLSGLKVTMLERDQDSLSAGLARANKILEQSHARGLIDANALANMQAALMGTVEYAAFSDADLVIEAVFEDMAVKRDVFKQLDAVTRPDAVLATNTSYLDIGEIAEVVADPSRVLGLHFFSPAYIMKLLEIIRPPKVADDVLATGFALAKRLQKIAVPAGVCDGFIANRMMSAYRLECEYMLEDGALPQEVDAAMMDFGFPMGIFAMQDLAGLDIAWAMRKRKAADRSPDVRYVDIADRLCEMGRFGRKVGKGWYDYTSDPKGAVDPVVKELILSESAGKGIVRQAINSEQIMERILKVMRFEGQNILDEGIAESADAINVVMVNGYGFPRWLGGPM